MVNFLSSQTKAMMVGNVAGWTLEFYRTTTAGTLEPKLALSISDTDYYASIKAVLPSNFAPGSYTFTIEGITDADYRQIAQTPNSKNPTAIKLYLYWHDTDTSVGSYVASASGLGSILGTMKKSDLDSALVSVLSITNVKRQAGTRRYEAVITAQERAFQVLVANRVQSRVDGANVTFDQWSMALDFIEMMTGIVIEKYGFGADGAAPAASGSHPGNERRSFHHGRTFARELQDLADDMEKRTNKHGRGMVLLREGKIHFGVRDIPLHGDSTPLHTSNGLIEAHVSGVRTGNDATPPHTGNASTETQVPGVGTGVDAVSLDGIDPSAPPARRTFDLLLKGRSDIKPGDVVKFEPAEEDVPPTSISKLTAVGEALAGAFMGSILPSLGSDTFQHPVSLYVTSVSHSLGRASGFFTTLSGLELPPGRDEWDPAPVKGAESGPGNPPAPADPAAHAAQQVERVATAIVASRQSVDIAEVRDFTTQGADEPAGQTETVFRGLEAPDGGSNGARRLAINRKNPSPVHGVAYATPFAWGECGLVLPRYPGTRVVLVHRDGASNDPIDVGALWESGQGPLAEAGDYWLLLPANVPQAHRATETGSAAVDRYADKVTHDLIDADGNRVIEVGQLTIRVGKSNLQNTGRRPDPAEADTVTITNPSKNSSIIMNADGSVNITAPNITFDAGTGTITMKADTVDVQVTTAMNVH